MFCDVRKIVKYSIDFGLVSVQRCRYKTDEDANHKGSNAPFVYFSIASDIFGMFPNRSTLDCSLLDQFKMKTFFQQLDKAQKKFEQAKIQ